MTAVLGLERGIPEVSSVRDLLARTSRRPRRRRSPTSTRCRAVGPLPPAPPAGNREIEEAFERIAVNVLLDRQSIEDTANQFMREARGILRRA